MAPAARWPARSLCSSPGWRLTQCGGAARVFVRVALHEAPGLGQGPGPIGQSRGPARRRGRPSPQPGHGDRQRIMPRWSTSIAARPQADRRQPREDYARFETRAARPSRSSAIPRPRSSRRSRSISSVTTSTNRSTGWRVGIAVRAWSAQPAVDVAGSAAARPLRQYDLPLQGRRGAALPAVADEG